MSCTSRYCDVTMVGHISAAAPFAVILLKTVNMLRFLSFLAVIFGVQSASGELIDEDILLTK